LASRAANRARREAAAGRATAGRATAAVCALAAALSIAVPPPVLAIELFGRTFFEPEREPLTPDSRPYEIEIVVQTDDRTLTSKVRAASQLLGDKDDVPPSTAALIARARGDYSSTR
jgi:hypothetical protein